MMMLLAAFLQADPVAIERSWIAEPTRMAKPEPGCLRTEAEWKAFWKAHAGLDPAPPANLATHMGLVMPAAVCCGDALQRTGPEATRVEVRSTASGLEAVLTLVAHAQGKPHRPGDPPWMSVTVVLVPRSPKPVEARVVSGGTSTPLGLLTPVTIKGTLQHIDLEGGVWILKQDGVTYDLHGTLDGFKAGDAVEVDGKLHTGGGCIHMCGKIFKVTAIRAAR
jgi:hypothetical protein